jgi:hypothetical protein
MARLFDNHGARERQLAMYRERGVQIPIDGGVPGLSRIHSQKLIRYEPVHPETQLRRHLPKRRRLPAGCSELKVSLLVLLLYS